MNDSTYVFKSDDSLQRFEPRAKNLQLIQLLLLSV